MATLFERIIAGELPSTTLYADDECVVILDINPILKGHALVISRTPYPTITDCPATTLGHMMEITQRVDAKLREVLGCNATNILINNGPQSGQEIPHLHIHVVPRYEGDGRKFLLEHEKYEDGEMATLGRKLQLKS